MKYIIIPTSENKIIKDEKLTLINLDTISTISTESYRENVDTVNLSVLVMTNGNRLYSSENVDTIKDLIDKKSKKRA